MPKEFDPFHVWLGIPPEEQPPNRYRLLGIRLFESNPDVIDSAADRQMAHLRTFQGGKHTDLTQRLLNEVAAARVCLLNPQKKSIYDYALRAAVTGSATQRVATPAAAPLAAPAFGATPVGQLPAANLPVAQAIEAPTPSVAPQAERDWGDLVGDMERRRRKGRGKSGQFTATRRRTNHQLVFACIGVGLLLTVGGVIAWYVINAASAALLTFDWPAGERAGVALSIDGSPVTIPASGRWEHRCEAGDHRIVALRPAFKFETTVSLDPGGEQAVVPDWKPKAILSLNWPLAQRHGAVLTVDGHIPTALGGEPLRLPVEPGRHVIHIVRPGLEPFETTVSVANDQRQSVDVTILDAGVNKPIVPARTPLVPRPIARPDVVGDATAPERTVPSVTPEETVPSAVKKPPVPSAAEQERIAKQIDELYKPTHSAENDRALAEQLFKIADESGNSADERYMLLTKGVGLATGAGDLNLAFRGIDHLDAGYEIDPFAAKQKLVAESVKTVTTADQAIAWVKAAEEFITRAVAADRYETALAVASTAGKALDKRSVNAQFRKEAAEQLSRCRREIALLQISWAATQEAQKVLDKDAYDAGANLTLGRWYCLCKGDWDRGLPLLAKGSDDRLKSLAEQELAANFEVKQQVPLADAWWEFGEKETDPPREMARLHAAEMYRLALPNLQSALKKAAIEKRLGEIDAIQRSTSGHQRQIDLLKLVDLKRDTVHGDWTTHGVGLTSDASQGAVIQFPYQPPDEYDFEVVFTRRSGLEDVVQVFVGGKHSILWAMSGWGGQISAFEHVNGIGGNENPTRREYSLTSGKRYISLLKVRRDRVEAWINGRLIDEWKTDFRDMEVLDPQWTLRDRSLMGIGSLKSPTTFHSAKVTEITGAGKVLAQPQTRKP